MRSEARSVREAAAFTRMEEIKFRRKTTEDWGKTVSFPVFSIFRMEDSVSGPDSPHQIKWYTKAVKYHQSKSDQTHLEDCMFTYYLCVLMAHACFCLHMFGFFPTNNTKRTKRFQRKQISDQFEGQNIVGYDLYRLCVSQAPCPDNISALLSRCFLLWTAAVTCQTMPPFTICNLLAFTSPTCLQRLHFKLSTKQKVLDCLFALHVNEFHTPTEAIFDLYRQILFVCDSLGPLWAGEPPKDNMFMFLSD